jgi:hypothetical protein
VRIARRRPAPLAVSPAMLLAAAAGCAALLAALVWWRTPAVQRAHDAPAGDATMASAYGLGGLPELRGRVPAREPAPSPLAHERLVTYYGNPYTPSMGVLGQHPPEDAADLLAQRAAALALDGAGPVLPALHVVYAVAQPADGGASLQYLDDRSVRAFIDLARRRGFVTVLDLQIGHSDPLAEVERIAPYLREPDVFVALDPEFALPGDTRPGQAIGSIDAGEINAVQAYLAALAERERLPRKVLIVHQFQDGMITGAADIDRRDDVDLVIDMDGYGAADIKGVKYRRYAGAAYAPYGGIKVFLQHDPDPLTDAQILALQPPPRVIVYQ